jgi:hypothetical protein
VVNNEVQFRLARIHGIEPHELMDSLAAIASDQSRFCTSRRTSRRLRREVGGRTQNQPLGSSVVITTDGSGPR